MKSQKGITLVALVITIIVMLILVAVSISVAMNGGLFTKADDATRETVKEQIKEAVTLAKAEILTDFYTAKNNAERVKPSTDEVEALIESYLDEDEEIGITVTETENGYTVTTDDTKVDFDEPITIDLEGVKFHTGSGNQQTNPPANNDGGTDAGTDGTN